MVYSVFCIMFRNERNGINVRCKVCRRIFCCAECRSKHEIAKHAIAVKRTTTATTAMAKITSSQIDCNLSANCNDAQIIYVFCPICQQKPLLLHDEIYEELMSHIQQQHLPLRCEKCDKIYTNIDDFKEFSKCANNNQLCTDQNASTYAESTCDTDASKLTVKRAVAAHSTMSTQTSPTSAGAMVLHQQDAQKDFSASEQLTPISIINMRWQAKSKITQEEFIGDSVSSIKNLSLISNSFLRRSIGAMPAPQAKAKLIRSTSTPVQIDTDFAKPKEPTFNATGGGQVSSIYNSGFETDQSPAVANAVVVTGQNQTYIAETNNVQRYYRKVTTGRHKMTAVATPLRQVMSKSIQKAFVEHGGMPQPDNNLQRRTMLQLIDRSANSSTCSTSDAPLDLRLSPAVRRTHSESDRNYLSYKNSHPEILVAAQHFTTESIVITCTKHQSGANIETATTNEPQLTISSCNSRCTSASNSAYKSCESIEIITATAELSVEQQSVGRNFVHATPNTRAPGASTIQKKLIKFETPKKEITKKGEDNASRNSPDEEFYTPSLDTPVSKLSHAQCAELKESHKIIVPRRLKHRFSPPQPRRPLRECAQSTAFSRIEDITVDTGDLDSEVFLPEQESTKHEHKKPEEQQQSASGIWSLMTSVMRLPKFKTSTTKKEKEDSPNDATNSNSISILKRCASIAGSLVRSKPMLDEEQAKSLKRKRTCTLDNQCNYNRYGDTLSPPICSKRVRIHGRKPIERMRLNS